MHNTHKSLAHDAPTRSPAQRLGAISRWPAMAALALLGSAAHAHHGMDGQLPATFSEGLISGLAHPVIGLDHLAFVVAAAWLIARFAPATRALMAGLFVAASALGTALHVQLVDLPMGELLVALSVLIAGVCLLARRTPAANWLWLALPVAGLVHGYAYGEAIVGAEATPLAAYLAGFMLIQWVMMFGFSSVLGKLPQARLLRTGLAMGVAVTAVGLWFSVQQVAGLA